MRMKIYHMACNDKPELLDRRVVNISGEALKPETTNSSPYTVSKSS